MANNCIRNINSTGSICTSHFNDSDPSSGLVASQICALYKYYFKILYSIVGEFNKNILQQIIFFRQNLTTSLHLF